MCSLLLLRQLLKIVEMRPVPSAMLFFLKKGWDLVKFHRDLKHDRWDPPNGVFFVREMGPFISGKSRLVKLIFGQMGWIPEPKKESEKVVESKGESG